MNIFTINPYILYYAEIGQNILLYVHVSFLFIAQLSLFFLNFSFIYFRLPLRLLIIVRYTQLVFVIN